MDVKQCECDALVLLRRMAGTYSAFIETSGPADYRYARVIKGMSSLYGEMSKHLEDQLNKLEYQGEAGEEARVLLSVTRQYTEMKNPITAMDILRDGLHQKPVVRQLFLCGRPYSPGKEVPLSQDVYELLHLMSSDDGTPEEAEEAFDKLYSEHTCESGEEAEE